MDGALCFLGEPQISQIAQKIINAHPSTNSGSEVQQADF